MSHTLNRQLGDAVIRKRLEKWRPNSWFLLHDNAPAHWSVSVKDFLAKNNVATVQHPSYSPDLVPVYFNVFPPMKLALQRRRFCNNNEIIKHAMERLKKLSQNGFQKCFTKWLPEMFPTPLQSLTEVYSCKRRLFWSKWMYCFVFLRNKV